MNMEEYADKIKATLNDFEFNVFVTNNEGNKLYKDVKDVNGSSALFGILGSDEIIVETNGFILGDSYSIKIDDNTVINNIKVSDY
ncbi:hypothetical protein PT285_06620 [Lactobacillus sp. ESL0791]|uniref:hypothetical protein n=1 Tax=Lactobacillus sp. ESL0791 TaxID=2983234 RepID=UPI0023FA040D|nr:hypothetical protein [Lactobacillus sp. ESL0791]MDF7639073.1 hypothetical protein [Lactobacillus sp. ESL0791]